jgi:dienelactone hydrolase
MSSSKSQSVHRRNFISAAAATGAFALFAPGASAAPRLAAPTTRPRISGTSPTLGTSAATFDVLRQVDAGELSVGYAEAGPTDGQVVILLHGWPYDIHSFVEVTPLLAAAGYRVIVPYLRGYGTTRFLSSDTFRNAQQAVFAVDVIALMDSLRIQQAVLGGFDWGARTADIVAALWPERVKALVAVSGYLIGNREANQMPLSPKAE